VAKQPESDFIRIIEILVDHKVDFIVVGGVSAVLHGAPVTTFDLDLVHSREPENRQKLTAALKEMNARYRGVGDRVITPAPDYLASEGHHLFITDYGPLDLLGTIGKELGYVELMAKSVDLTAGPFRLRVLMLEELIRLKTELGMEKDLAVLPVLRSTLKEKKG
jgi:hypothetical protein